MNNSEIKIIFESTLNGMVDSEANVAGELSQKGSPCNFMPYIFSSIDCDPKKVIE